MAIPGHEFLTAHFSNNDRTIVESYWTTPDGKETRVEYIEAKEGDPSWENLLTHMDIDTLHESTYKQIRAQNEAFEDDVIKIGKERGLIYDLTDNNAGVYKMIAHALFQNFNEEEDKERLFLFKLELFELLVLSMLFGYFDQASDLLNISLYVFLTLVSVICSS